jgi:IS4 transposase
MTSFKCASPRRHYPDCLRRVEVIINLDGNDVVMTFLTNNFEWSAQSIADLYRCRWDIEKFFKQIKQSLQLCDFLGNNANAVHWQIWIALLVYVLLRFLAFLSQWSHSFTRLWALTRTALWRKIDFLHLLRRYGTARGDFHLLAQPQQAYFAGF